jgi:hypothetical protein
VAYFTTSLPRELYKKLDNSIVESLSGTKLGSVFENIASLLRRALEFVTNVFGRRKPSSPLREANTSSIILDLLKEYEYRKRSAMESFMLSSSDQ